MARQIVISLALLFIGISSVYTQGTTVAKKEIDLDEARKHHNNTWYQTPPGMKLVEIDIAGELAEGDMRGFKVGEKDGKDEKVLVACYQGKIYATGSSCSHFGVDLTNGMLFDDKVLCPAHAAGFSIKTGKPEQAPGLDGIPSYLCIHRDDKWFVEVPEEGLPKKATMPMTKRDPNNPKHFVIVGGGAAGLNCAETLRQSGFSGRVTIVSKEDLIPYDRTMLSKSMIDSRKKPLRPAEFLASADIDFKLSAEVSSVNSTSKIITLSSGETMKYDKLCVATGGKTVPSKLPGANLKGVF